MARKLSVGGELCKRPAEQRKHVRKHNLYIAMYAYSSIGFIANRHRIPLHQISQCPLLYAYIAV